MTTVAVSEIMTISLAGTKLLTVVYIYLQ